MTEQNQAASADQTIVAYTDGACKGTPGVGGYGCSIRFPEGFTKEANGRSPNTTNNRAELRGAIAALELTPKYQPLRVIVDSEYVLLGITERLPYWRANGWRTAAKKPVKNVDLWKHLDVATTGREIADLNGQWIDRFHGRNGLKFIVLDMDSSVSPTHGDQEGSAWNGHFDCTCYHPNFLFNQFGMLERCALRNGNVHSADCWRDVLDPVIASYAKRDLGGRFFRADAAYAIPAIYERLEEVSFFHATRLPANNVLREKIALRLTRPVGRPSLTKVKRFFEDFYYQATSWGKERRVIAKIEWHPGELFPRVGLIVTNLPMEPDWIVRFYNQRGTAQQHIKEGKYAFRWTRLFCQKFRDNEVRLQLNALAYNLATFLRCIKLPDAMADWSLTSLQLKLIKIGARVVRHARAITFQLAEVAVTGPMVRAILAAIRRLRAPPSCA